MISDSELGRMLFGEKRQSGIHTIEAVAVETSSDGTVKVIPSGIAAGVDASFYVKTQGGVNVGDTVIVTVENGAPINAVSSGSVDIVRTLAEQSQGAYTDDSTYYLLSSTVPATPTDDTWEDAGWSTSEPIIGQEETRTLYVSRRVELVDGTVTWSEPAKVVTSASLDVMRNAIMSTVSETYTTKTEFAESSDTASGSGRTVETEDAAGLELIDLAVYGESVQDGTPSPDAPVEIRTVSGVNLLANEPCYWGANYYNKGVGSSCKNSGSTDVAFSATDGFFTIEVKQYSWRGVIVPTERLEPGTYHVSFGISGTISQGSEVYILDADYKVVRNAAVSWSAKRTVRSLNVTLSSGETYIALGLGSGNTGGQQTVTVEKPSVVRADSLCPYIPYGKIAVASIGQNLIEGFSHDFADAMYWKQLSTDYISQLGDGWAHFEKDNSEATSYSRLYYRIDYGEALGLEPDKDYWFLLEFRNVNNSSSTFSFYASIASTSAGYIAPWTESASTYVVEGSAVLHVKTKADLSSADCTTYGRFQVNAGASASFDVRMSLYDHEPTAYEPYRESISYIPLQGNVLASLPDGTKDVLHVEQGRAWIEKKVGYQLLDGSESWGMTGTARAWTQNNAIERVMDYSDKMLCDRIPVGVGSSDANLSLTGFRNASSYAGQNWVYVNQPQNLGISSAATAKSYFAANQTSVYYKLATPDTIDLGEVSLPTVQDGDTVRIIAEVQPVFDASWWRNTDIVERTTDLETVVKQTAIDVTTAITEASEAASGVEQMQTLIRQYSDGVLVSRTGNEVGALVNADGSFDIVEVSWSGRTPTAGNVLASFGATSANIGAWVDDTQAGDTAELTFFGGSATMRFTVGETRDYLQLESGSLDLLAHDGLAINGHNVNPSGWNLVRQFTGNGAVNFPDLSQTYPYGTNQPYTEVMVAARHSSNYMGSAVIPISLISSTAQETYLSGGATYGGGGRAFCVNLSLTQMTAVAATIDNADYMATTVWYLFAR